MSTRPTFRVGTSGWNYKHWRERFYPAGLPEAEWFAHFSRAFDTVEINNTFYHLPPIQTFDKWQKQAPARFCFAVKANRFITHVKKLNEPAQPLRLFLTRARHLKDHLGPVLYQLPPRWNPNVDRLRTFCELLPKDLTHVVEFRNRAWLTAEVLEILRSNRVCLCLHDILPDHPREITGPSIYVRFHGTSGHNGNYSDAQLRDWASWLRDNAPRSGCVYAYFNNDVNAYAISNALKLREFLEE